MSQVDFAVGKIPFPSVGPLVYQETGSDFLLPLVVRLDYVARIIVNPNHSIM